MRKYTLIGLDRQNFDFNRPQAEQFETFDVFAESRYDALCIGRKTHACTIAVISG
ncbi:hypothetical protein VCHA31O73_360034 [Vibrio chagasii]|nr:hypothetical protein VCHA31O73_360034 [Vibrio chagasii]